MKQKAGTEKWEEGRDLLWEEAMKPSTLGAAMVAPSSRAPTTKPAISLDVSPSISPPSALALARPALHRRKQFPSLDWI